MLTLQGRPTSTFCDGLNRRDFLAIGGLGLSGLIPQQLLGATPARAENHNRSVISIHLEGGPPQMDTFDLKPDGPVDLRGEFRPIRTNVPGISICELLPRLAGLADKYSILRTVVGNVDAHNFDTTQLGYAGMRMPNPAMKSIGGAPAVGSVISRLLGPNGGMPPFVWDGVGGTQEGVQTGYLNAMHGPFRLDNAHAFRRNLPLEHIHDRVNLLRSLDSMRRDIDATGQMEAMDVFTQRAVAVLQSGKLGEALDLSREDVRVRDRYLGDSERFRSQSERFLLARRLVEAGVRYVAMNWGGYLGFDSHEENYPKMRQILPPFDSALGTLIADLYERGLDRDVLLVIWAEFGRTPRINDKGSRDHWPAVQSALVVGGGLRMGQVIGATDRIAGEPTDRPVHVHELLATVYRHVGINVRETQLIDPAGRPRYLLDHHDPIHELT